MLAVLYRACLFSVYLLNRAAAGGDSRRSTSVPLRLRFQSSNILKVQGVDSFHFLVGKRRRRICWMHSAKQTAVVHLLLLFLLNISNCGGGFEMIEQEEVQHADVHFLGAKKKGVQWLRCSWTLLRWKFIDRQCAVCGCFEPFDSIIRLKTE